MVIHPGAAEGRRSGAGGVPDPTAPLPGAGGEPIWSAFARAAAAKPGAVAVVSEAGRWTYGELELATALVAARLRSLGVGPGSVVMVLGTRSSALVAAMIGVSRSGAAFWIADSAYPAGRLAAGLGAVRPGAVLVCDALEIPEELRGPIGEGFVRVPSEAGALIRAFGGAGARGPEVATPPDADAYVTFTSGSTGRPKGIVTGHAPLVHFVGWHAAQHGLTGEDRFSMLSGLSHDPLLRDVFTPLSLGGTLCIPPQATVFSAAELPRWMSRERVTVCHLTPALGEILVTGAEQDGVELPDLRSVFWGGDVLSQGISARVRALAPGSSQVNFYGATETPQAMGHFPLREAGPEGSFPVGRGIEGAQLLVVREGGGLAAPGETGEIWIRSPYLSRGYLGDPEQTAARFVVNPFTGDPADRCYRTGDLGKYLPDGNVVFAGRADFQLKIRGFRVEPAEVSHAAEAMAGVTRALVLARSSGEGPKHLVAYVTCEAGSGLDAAGILEGLRRTLPAYMVPTYAVRLEAFPLLPNGKIDVQSLPAPRDEDRGVSGGYVAPASERERQIATLWEGLLGLERVGVNDSFLALGGDSLTALRALVRMKRLGIPASVARGIFQGRTVREIAAEGEGGPGFAPSGAMGGEARTNLLINVLRGVLLGLVVADHWSEGILARVAAGHGEVLKLAAPVFNLATPGFALVFGVGLGYVHCARFAAAPRQTTRTLMLGAWLLLAGIGVRVGLELALRSGRLSGSTEFFSLFFSALLYYFTALCTAPLWLWAVSRARRPFLTGGLLVLASYVLHRLCVQGLLAREQEGFLQLVRLMLVAKFAYFNMSVGALSGLLAGVWLRRSAGGPVSGRLLVAGTALAGLGLAMAAAGPDGLAAMRDPTNMDLWRWVFYGGVVSLLAGASAWVIGRLESLPAVVTGVVRLLAVFGQCTFPVFLMHGYVLQVNKLMQSWGVPGSVSLPLVLLAFLAACGWLMGRLYSVYYGRSDAAA